MIIVYKPDYADIRYYTKPRGYHFIHFFALLSINCMGVDVKCTFPTNLLTTYPIHVQPVLRDAHITHRIDSGSGLCLLPDSDLDFAQKAAAPVEVHTVS